jgi:hypothetical protein
VLTVLRSLFHRTLEPLSRPMIDQRQHLVEAARGSVEFPVACVACAPMGVAEMHVCAGGL